MNRSNLILSLGVLLFGFTIQSFAQVVELPEITITAANYKYLNAVGEETAVPVKQLEQEVANYDVKKLGFYSDEYDTYFVTFFIPEGKILASYDADGKLLRTAERFKDIDVPSAVRQAVAEKYPNWGITKDVYLVKYHDEKGVTQQVYKLVLENGDKRIRVKLDESGEYM